MTRSGTSSKDALVTGGYRTFEVGRGIVQNVIPRRAVSVSSRALEGEAVLVHRELKKVAVLNGVGARLWELADGQHSVAEIARVIADEYEVSLVKAESDALTFCRDLVGRGLLTLDS